MNRAYTADEYCERIARLRDAVPGIGITSDIIVGFPGETEKDFQDTVNAVKDICFDDLFIFHYTHRRGTKAALLTDTVSYDTKIKRLKLLNEIQREISLSRNRRLVGTMVSVLFDAQSKRGSGTLAGRTRTNKVVNCEGAPSLIGKTAAVKIERGNIHSLSGTLLQKGKPS